MKATLVIQRKRSRDYKNSNIFGVFNNPLQAKPNPAKKNSYYINTFKAKTSDNILLHQRYETLQLFTTEETTLALQPAPKRTTFAVQANS